MSTATLAEMLTTAMTATEGPAHQTAGITHNIETHEVLGDVPIAVQWLHELGNQLTDEINALVDKCCVNGSCSRNEAIHEQIAQLSGRIDTFNDVKWALLKEAFPTDDERYDGLAILMDWKVAARLKSEDSPDNLGDLLGALMGGKAVVVGVSVGTKGRRRFDA